MHHEIRGFLYETSKNIQLARKLQIQVSIYYTTRYETHVHVCISNAVDTETTTVFFKEYEYR